MPGTKFLYMIPLLIKNEGKENNIKKKLKCFLVSKALPQSSKIFLVLTKQTMTDKVIKNDINKVFINVFPFFAGL